MAESSGQNEGFRQHLAKCPTGIQGLDEITNGGLPRGRPTLICGAAGCGKTLMAMEMSFATTIRCRSEEFPVQLMPCEWQISRVP